MSRSAQVFFECTSPEENVHTVPAIETLEKFARALEIPIYQLFYDGEEPPTSNVLTPTEDGGWGTSGRDAQTLHRFRVLMSRMNPGELKLLLAAAQKMARRKKRGSRRRPAAVSTVSR